MISGKALNAWRNGLMRNAQLLNEPWFGDVWSKPLEPLEPGAADRDYLAPLYSKVYAVGGGMCV